MHIRYRCGNHRLWWKSAQVSLRPTRLFADTKIQGRVRWAMKNTRASTFNSKVEYFRCHWSGKYISSFCSVYDWETRWSGEFYGVVIESILKATVGGFWTGQRDHKYFEHFFTLTLIIPNKYLITIHHIYYQYTYAMKCVQVTRCNATTSNKRTNCNRMLSLYLWRNWSFRNQRQCILS